MKPKEIKKADMHLTRPSATYCIDVKICAGCRKHYQNVVDVDKELERFLYGYPLPSKFKIGVSGCRNSCAELRVGGNDLSLIGMLKGWKIVVWGRDEAMPRVDEELASELTSEQSLEMVGKVLDYYRNSGTTERLGKHLAKVGIEDIKKVVKFGESGGTRNRQI